MEAIILNCIQCEEDFEFSIYEQQKYNQKGFDLPLRCPQCRKNKAKKSGVEEKRKPRDKRKNYRPRSDDDDYFD